MPLRYCSVLVSFLLAIVSLVPLSLAAQAPNSQTANAAMRIKVGGNVQTARILSKVQPTYPDEARRQRIEGQVVLHAVINTDGTIAELNVISGPKELTQSALDAVKQWRYESTKLNGVPVEVDTTITVNYQLTPSQEGSVASHELPSADSSASQEKEREALAAVDPETVTDIKRLLEITGAVNLISQVFNSQMPLVKAQLLQNLPADADRQEIADRLIEKMEEAGFLWGISRRLDPSLCEALRSRRYKKSLGVLRFSYRPAVHQGVARVPAGGPGRRC